MDDDGGFRELILKLEKQFGRKIAPFQVPIRENEKFVGFVNAVKMEGRRFTHLGEYEKCEIPEYTKKNLGIIRDALIEAVAETSEEYMERYFSGEEFTQEEIAQALREHVSEGNIVPVMMGSVSNAGASHICCRRSINTSRHRTSSSVSVSMYRPQSALPLNIMTMYPCRHVFSQDSLVDPFIGKYSLMKDLYWYLKTRYRYLQCKQRC